MPTWGELQSYVRQNLRMLDDGPSSMALGWQYQEKDGTPGRQALFVYEMPAYGETWLVMAADICPEEAISPRDALIVNSELTLGALAIREGVYGLRYTFSIQSLPLPDILIWMERLVWAAVEVRERLAKGTLLGGAGPATQGRTAVVHTHWTD